MEDFFDRLQAIVGISKYSNSEVITPLNIVKDMVDLLPADIFKPEAKFLDPAVKSGRFLAEIYRRLMDSPLLSHMDEQSRRRHILENQLYGLATSGTAATIVRKQLYDDPTIAGNIVYIDRYLTLMADKGTDFRKLIEKEFGQMKFDVVIGNPPYSDESGGGGRTSRQGSTLYNKFIELGLKIADMTCMITKNNWLSSDTLSDIRDKMIKTGLVCIKNYPAYGEVFDDISVSVASFLVKKGYVGETKYQTVSGGVIINEYISALDGMGCVPECGEAASIMLKTKTLQRFDSEVYSKMPFGIASDGKIGATGKGKIIDTSVIATDYYDTPILFKDGYVYMSKEEIPKNREILNYYKIACGQQLRRDQKVIYNITPVTAGRITTQSFAILYASENMVKATNACKYLKTKFTRFLVRCITDEICTTSPIRFKLVPAQDFTSNSDIDWSQSVADIDKQLYKKYGLSPEEIEYIENTIKPME